MIAPRPKALISLSIPALPHTRVMVALLRRFLYPEKMAGPGKAERISYSAPVLTTRGKSKKRSTFSQRLLSHTAGLLVLYTYAVVILVRGGWSFGFSREQRERRRKLAFNREALWCLDREPYPGVKHRFYTDEETGIRIHYVEAGNTSVGSELVILLHGFPDSFYSYRHQLTSANLQHAHLIAPDLPGFGGSDSLPDYGPSNVLNVVAKFILAMKSKKSHDRCVLVGHNWGTIVTCRLVSECPTGTFSRAVIINGLHPALLNANVDHNLNSFSRTAKSTIFAHHPLHILFSPARAKRDLARLLRSWSKNIIPILTQAKYSHYVFPMRLPWMMMARRFHVMADYWVLRELSISAYAADAVSYIANALGPGIEQCLSVGGYPVSVRKRKGYELDSMISYYRDGLASFAWEEKDKPFTLREDILPGRGYQKPEDRNSRTRGDGRFKCPAVVAWGSKDPYYTPQLVHNGWGKMFCYDAEKGGSATIMLGNAGHWMHASHQGKEVINGILEWCVEEGQELARRGEAEKGNGEGTSQTGLGLGHEGNYGSRIRELQRLVPMWYDGDESIVNCF